MPLRSMISCIAVHDGASQDVASNNAVVDASSNAAPSIRGSSPRTNWTVPRTTRSACTNQP